jgi:glycosyltransferase involved in cell wall biosynthesis
MSSGRPLHVLVLAADLTHRHGWAQYSKEMVRALDALGVRLTVLTARDGGPPDPSVPVPAHPVLPGLSPLEGGMVPRGWLLAPRVRRMAASADVVHVLAEPYAALGFGAAEPYAALGFGGAGPYPAPGLAGSYPAPGLAEPYPAPGLAGSYPAPDLAGPYPAPGLAEPYPAPGLAGSYPAPGLAEPYPAPGPTEPYPAPRRRPNTRRPLIITAHGSYIAIEQWAGRLWRWAYRRAFARAAYIVCVSEYTRALAAARFAAPTVAIPNGVDAARFAHLPPLAARSRADGYRVVSVGAVKPRKGTLELVRAVAAARAAIPDLRADIVGSLTADAPYAAAVQAEIARLGAGGFITLHGAAEPAALLEHLGRAHLAVLPSMNQGWQFEGFGLALLEASAAGLPVIGTRECGAADAVADGETGLLVSQAEIAHALPAAVARIAGDPARAAAMGEAGRTRAAAFTWARAAAAVMRVYEAAAGWEV